MFRTVFFILPLAAVCSDPLAEEYSRMLAVQENETNETLLIGSPTSEPPVVDAPPPATPAPTEEGDTIAPTPAPMSIKQEFVISGIDYTALSDADKTALSDGIKAEVLESTEWATADTVTVTLSAGSVAVEIMFTEVPAAEGAETQTMMADEASVTMMEAYVATVVETIATANGIPTTGTIGVSGFSASTVTSAPTSAPAEEGVASSAFSEKVPLASKVAVAFAGVAIAAMA